ncbi:PucR family transcriptional regulator ligand-binding domain-containing protein, partial [Actinomadura fulvescens]
MPRPTLRGLVRAEGLGLRVLTGAELPDRTVRWVFTTDLPDPSRYLAGGELVLTGLMWRREPGDSERFVAAVARRGAVGLGAGAAALGEIPPDLVAACERHGLPLLEVPADVSFATLTRWVTAESTRDAGDRRGALLASVAASGALSAPLALLAAELDRPCWIISPTGRTLAATDELPAQGAEAITRRFHRAGGEPRTVSIGGSRFALRPLLPAPKPPAGYLLAVRDPDDRDLTVPAGDLAAALGAHLAREAERANATRALGDRLVRGVLDDDRTARAAGELLADLGFTRRPIAVAVSVTGPDGAAVARFLIEDLFGHRTGVAVAAA